MWVALLIISTLLSPFLPTPCYVLDTQSQWLFLNMGDSLVSFLSFCCSFARRFPCFLYLANSYLFFLFSLLILYFDIISEKNCKIGIKNSHTPFTQIPQMSTFPHICIIILLSFSLPLASPNTIFF